MVDSDATARIVALEKRHTSGVYPTRDVALVRGRNARLWDANGREYLDCAAGHGVVNVGHAHPRVAAAIAEQAQRLITCPGSFPNDKRSELSERLAALLPAGLTRLFFCNSGTEAMEAAIKIARLSTGRTGVLATMRGFHGRTMGALSATWDPKYREPFAPLVPGYTHVPYDRLEAAAEAIGATTACVVVEIVQGEGGVRPGSGEYFRGLRRLCDERGALLVVDEVQTGFGRTGRMFACEHHGVVPDLLCLSKAIAGGLPMGVVAIGPRVAELPNGAHGSTFGGNPLACAAALAVLDVFRDEKLVERAAELGAWLFQRLRAIDAPIVREVRGLGMMAGVELKTRVTPILQRLMERGVIALPAGPTVLRLLPPLTIPREDLERALTAVAETLALHVEAGAQAGIGAEEAG
jgi:predicted acetylornithine/succinylornithine family transaminase